MFCNAGVTKLTSSNVSLICSAYAFVYCVVTDDLAGPHHLGGAASRSRAVSQLGSVCCDLKATFLGGCPSFKGTR